MEDDRRFPNFVGKNQYKQPASAVNQQVRMRFALLMMDTCWLALLTGETRIPFPYLPFDPTRTEPVEMEYTHVDGMCHVKQRTIH